MKHPVSVAELLELHRLGDLFLKWTATPFAMKEEDLQELQEIADRYHINHSSALFSFQRKYQQEMAISVEETIDEAIEAIPGLAHALSMVPTTPLIAKTPAQEFAQLKLDRGSGTPVDMSQMWELADLLGYDLQEFYGHFIGHARKLWPGEAVWFENKARELGVQVFEMKVQQPRVAPPEYEIPEEIRLQREEQLRELAERDAALRDQLHEDNEVDREDQAAHAEQLRSELAGLTEAEVEREIEILQQISNVDELTPEESSRFDELVNIKVTAMNSGAKHVPAGVVQDAITTGHIQKVR